MSGRIKKYSALLSPEFIKQTNLKQSKAIKPGLETMTEVDVIKELMDTEPFLRLYPTFKSYLREIEGVSVDLALELYASHVLPGDVVKLVNVYISRA